MLFLLAGCGAPVRDTPAVSSTERPPAPSATAARTAPPEPPRLEPDTAATGGSDLAGPRKAPPPVAGPKLPPVDGAAADPSFVSFRTRLLDAVGSRNADGVVALSDPRISTSFGGDGGLDELRRLLAKDDLWRELETILTLGGAFRGQGAGRSFWAPYVYSNWPEAHDAFEHFAVIAESVPLREKASGDAASIATLSWDIVRRASPASATPRAWEEVKTADGKTGFVESKFLRSPIGYRAGFMKVGGEWKMNALVAGD